jgi:phage gp45-like
MPVSREVLDQLRHLLRPIATRVANTVARAVVQLVDDGRKLQLVQVGVMAGETVEGDGGAEHFQPYGLSSVPLPGAEGVVLFPNGDRSHPLVVVVSDRRHRPTGGQPGQVTFYNHVGAKVILMASGDVEVQPAPGREVLIREPGGSVDRLVKKSEFDGHKHAAGSFAAPNGAVTGTSAGAAAVAGTQRLRVQ